MKSVNMRAVNNSKGFTLIELMIVVAIIGILSAIAIPNFARYQSKSRQSEAKIALASIYGGEKAFYAEYSAYIDDLSAIGYTPEGFKRYYALGWSSANTSNVTGYAGAISTTPSIDRINFPAGWTACTTVGNLPATVATDPDAQTFNVGATGQIRQGAAGCDIWMMDNTKNLRNTTINL